jgi:hypothetical protein
MRSLTVPSVLRRIRFISAVAFVSVLAIPAGAFAKSSALVVTPKTLNLGNEVFGVSGATSTAQQVTISNPKKSSASITISSFSLGGKDSGDFAVQDPHNCKDSAVTPDSSCIVEVTFTPTALGARSATFTATDSAGNSTKAITVKGKGTAGVLGIGTKEISFGRVQLGTSSTMQETLTNANSVALAISGITTKGSGFTSQNCVGTLAASGGTCTVSVTFTPTSGKTAKGTPVSGSLVLTDDAAGSPQKVKLSAVEFGPAASGTATPTQTATPTPTPAAGHPTPTAVPGGTPFAIKAAGIYVFNTATGVASPQIIQYSTDTSTGATSESTMAGAGTGLLDLTFTTDGKHAYGADSTGNIWAYSASSTGALTSVGSPTAPPAATTTPPLVEAYDSSVLWVAPENISGATSVTVQQYPISGNGTLGSPTVVTLTGNSIRPFTPQGSNVPTAVWAMSAGSVGSLSTLTVYPVNSNGTINGTSSQTISVPVLFPATTEGFAYGIGGTFGAQTLYSYSLSSNGILTANPTVSLPMTAGFWESANVLAPEVASTLDFIDTSFNFVVYPVNSSGVVGTNLQTTMLTGSTEFPYSVSFNTSSGASTFSYLPTVWIHAVGSTTVNESTINSDGTIGGSAGSVTTGSGVLILEPEQSPFSYGVDEISGAVYGYQVGSTGALTAEGSFVPTIPSGQALFADAFPFKTAPSGNPVALFLYAFDESTGASGTILVYPLGSNGMPSGAPLDTISTSGQASESYVVFQNGQVQPYAFGGE